MNRDRDGESVLPVLDEKRIRCSRCGEVYVESWSRGVIRISVLASCPSCGERRQHDAVTASKKPTGQ
jgi:hypothetical protein